MKGAQDEGIRANRHRSAGPVPLPAALGPHRTAAGTPAIRAEPWAWALSPILIAPGTPPVFPKNIFTLGSGGF